MKTPGEPGVGIETKTNDSPKRAKSVFWHSWIKSKGAIVAST